MTYELKLHCGSICLLDQEEYINLVLLRKRKWRISSNGYVVRGSWNKRTKSKGVESIHRVIMCPPPGMFVDHINHNKLDNRRCNLRICTPTQNMANRLTWGDKASVYKGVYKSRKRWRASIMINGKKINLGSFDSQEDAAKEYDRAAIRLFGEFALTNGLEF